MQLKMQIKNKKLTLVTIWQAFPQRRKDKTIILTIKLQVKDKSN
jgi:hypothetical protein